MAHQCCGSYQMEHDREYYEAVRHIYEECQNSDWVYDEVITEFLRYRINHPSGDIWDQVRTAFSETAHQ